MDFGVDLVMVFIPTLQDRFVEWDSMTSGWSSCRGIGWGCSGGYNIRDSGVGVCQVNHRALIFKSRRSQIP